jgi:hypothetical protein
VATAALVVGILVVLVGAITFLPKWLAQLVGSTDGLGGEAKAEEIGRMRTALLAFGAGILAAVPSLSTSGETLTIEESMNLEGETGARRDVGIDYEWSCGWCCRRPRRPASRRRAGIRGRRARRAGGGA